MSLIQSKRNSCDFFLHLMNVVHALYEVSQLYHRQHFLESDFS